MQLDTIFRIYSMTKPVTSVALMRLYEEGHFQLNDPVSKFIPEFADVKVFTHISEEGYEAADLEREITMWHLLTYKAGLTYDFFEGSPVDAMYREAVFINWTELSRRKSAKSSNYPLYTNLVQPGATAWQPMCLVTWLN